MLDRLADSDWENAFAYASGVRAEYGCGCNSPAAAFPGCTTSVAPFTRDDVSTILAIVDGEGDGDSWLVVGQLHDGRWFSLEAGCDYTGWDWQASGSSAVADTKEDILRFGLTVENRKRLGLSLPDDPQT